MIIHITYICLFVCDTFVYLVDFYLLKYLYFFIPLNKVASAGCLDPTPLGLMSCMDDWVGSGALPLFSQG